MKYCLFLMMLAWMSSANGQSDMFNSTNNPGSSATLEAYDLSGKRIPTGSESAVEGTRLLNEHYEKGIVKFKNGEEYKDVALNFSLVSNELYFRKDSLELAFLDPVEQFALPVRDGGKEKRSIFKSGYPNTGNQTNKSFYQVLTDGPKLELLKYRYKVVREPYSYGGPVKKIYVLEERLYIYDPPNSAIFEINTNIRSLKQSLPAYSQDIDKFALENKIKFKKEEEIKSFVDSINKLP